MKKRMKMEANSKAVPTQMKTSGNCRFELSDAYYQKEGKPETNRYTKVKLFDTDNNSICVREVEFERDHWEALMQDPDISQILDHIELIYRKDHPEFMDKY
jgi:hypothetical protein